MISDRNRYLARLRFVMKVRNCCVINVNVTLQRVVLLEQCFGRVFVDADVSWRHDRLLSLEKHQVPMFKTNSSVETYLLWPFHWVLHKGKTLLKVHRFFAHKRNSKHKDTKRLWRYNEQSLYHTEDALWVLLCQDNRHQAWKCSQIC